MFTKTNMQDNCYVKVCKNNLLMKNQNLADNMFATFYKIKQSISACCYS